MKKIFFVLVFALLLFSACDSGHKRSHKQGDTLAARKVLIEDLIKETDKNMTIVDILLLGFEVKGDRYMLFEGIDTLALEGLSANFEEFFDASNANLEKLNSYGKALLAYNKKYERTKDNKMTNKLMRGRMTLAEAQQLRQTVVEFKEFIEKAKANKYNFKF